MITVEWNDDGIEAAFARLGRALINKRPLMEDIGEHMVSSTQDRVQRGLTPDGMPFAERAAATLEIYARKKFSYGLPLNRSGALLAGIFSEATEDSLTVGSNAIQAAVMQFGAGAGQFGAFIGKDRRGRDHFHSIPFGDIPARPFIGLSDQNRLSITQIIEEWIEDAVR